MSTLRTNKLKLAITGPGSAPKLFAALQLAYALEQNWNRIIVIGPSNRDGMYRHLGEYQTFRIDKDSPPSRYTELSNVAASCKDVIIFSNLSDEWLYGTCQHLQSSYYEDVLASHRMLFHALKHLPVHVIGLIDTRITYLQKDGYGKRKLRQEQLIQQPEVADHFITVLRLDKKGFARVEKDNTKVLPTGDPFKISRQHGALLSNWCRGGEPVISHEVQQKIDQCTSLAELYQLLFDLDVDDVDLLSAFTRRRMQLDEERKEPTLEIIPGGLL